ncbi:glycosyltransferase family 2 protein [Oceanotoga sp. DSM 15011]|nr:glycosyltransferase family A protein [Oceanotoga sp. DSM 15011]UYO99160.1 glycosyltransferase family 2 protein [Oceanotoga sp. DSM 15011]
MIILKNNTNFDVNNIKISVIIPVHNSERYIKNTLNSILKQTLNDLELILVVNGSKDKSLSISKNILKNKINIYGK